MKVECVREMCFNSLDTPLLLIGDDGHVRIIEARKIVRSELPKL
jgi:hypothetical protein